MTSYHLFAYLHIVLVILLVGYTLFWVIMALAVALEEAPTETGRLLGVINAGRWPPGGVPYAMRLRFPWLGWLFLALLGLTGGLLFTAVGDRVSPGVIHAKLALFGLLVVGHALATRRPTRPLAFFNGACALAIVLLSALLRH